jgi:TPR repeat protein
MRRQDIRLLAMARQGDSASRLEAGRRYLAGVDGFPRHIKTGISYLTDPSVVDLPAAARIIAEGLALEDIVLQQQQGALGRAALSGSSAARVKLAAWLLVRYGRVEEGTRWLESAGDSQAARDALAVLRDAPAPDRLPKVLRILGASGDLDGLAVAVISTRDALAQGDSEQVAAGLQTALALTTNLSAELVTLVADAIKLAERKSRPLGAIDPDVIEQTLDRSISQGDRDASYTLGRALCGIPCGTLSPSALTASPNLRKGVALLLRAADAGCDDAWLHLYRLHGDHRLSVANPQMARFCLEKAALAGQPEAQRRLGALMLRASDCLADTEQAIQWLHRAANANDVHARTLLSSLVLPLEGCDDDASWAAGLVEREDPWLALRLRLSRHFGLTKLEALCVDPAQGLRPWGLVVGMNPFTTQTRLSAARAIPATSPTATEVAKQAASFFGRESPLQVTFEGDMRRRSLRQLRLFERHGLKEAMFFANATSTTLESLRLGPKWAFRAKEALQMALAA